MEERYFNRKFHGGFEDPAKQLLIHYINAADMHMVDHVMKPIILNRDVDAFADIFWGAIRREIRWLH